MLNLEFKGIEDVKKTGAVISLNNKLTKVTDAEIMITDSGYGLEHELVELDIMATVLKNCPEVINFDYEYCRSLFHYYTNQSLGMKNHVAP